VPRNGASSARPHNARTLSARAIPNRSRPDDEASASTIASVSPFSSVMSVAPIACAADGGTDPEGARPGGAVAGTPAAETTGKLSASTSTGQTIP
jgi:hypothetical protein